METTVDLPTEELLINMGPQHPSTHGVLRLVLTIDGERVIACVPHIGYLHSSLEKIAETKTYQQYLPYSDRYDYLNAMGNELAYVRAVEKLCGIEVTRRCEFLRIIMAEMNRLASHLLYFGVLGLDSGAVTPFLYCFREREVLIQLFEDTSGQRLLYHYNRIGGLRNDLPSHFIGRLREFLGYFPKRIDEYDALLTDNIIFRKRLEGIGTISQEQCWRFSLSGPVIRGSGIAQDLRRVVGYSIYPELEFEVPTQPEGDAFARHIVRVEEMRQSIHILEQCLDMLPDGEINVKVPRRLKPVVGEAYERVESPRGELGCYLVSDGSETPWRLHWRAPSFYNLQVFPELARGAYIADLVIILASLDIVLPDIDR
jgi:NADH-quinone oxidoreductase subunit D